MLEELKKQVCEANLQLVADGLVVRTWGNVSGIDRSAGCVVIKPSGVPYAEMKPGHMVVVSLASGQTVEGELNPSSDTRTHLELYRAFDQIGGVSHTHSLFATAWAQARREIPPLGTTHADNFYGPVLCTRRMLPAEIAGDYETNTGKVIVERFAELDAMLVPAVLVDGHGPFTWGKTPHEAAENAFVLEHLARLASETLSLNPKSAAIQEQLLNKHFLRKHGPDATYGQK